MSSVDDKRSFTPVNIAVLTVSDSRTVETDASGALLAERVLAAGHRLIDRAVVRDDADLIAAQLSTWIAADDVDVVISTGGTGVTGGTGRDVTPEAIAGLMGKEIPGFGELFRLGFASIGTSTIQCRAVAAVAGGTYLFALPGSTGACRDGWDQILVHQLDARTRPRNLVELMPRLREP